MPLGISEKPASSFCPLNSQYRSRAAIGRDSDISVKSRRWAKFRFAIRERRRGARGKRDRCRAGRFLDLPDKPRPWAGRGRRRNRECHPDGAPAFARACRRRGRACVASCRARGNPRYSSRAPREAEQPGPRARACCSTRQPRCLAPPSCLF